MKISNIIVAIKDYYKGTDEYGNKINENTTRDKVLYGDIDKDCTGIVTTCWPSVDVINETAKLGANLIICHEALFWNHGDHQEWLIHSKNETYFEKKALLDKYGITVWRNHDYIHSGIPLEDGTYADGIFYGLMKKLNIEKYLSTDNFTPNMYSFPEESVKDIARFIVDKLELNGAKIIGNPDTKVDNAMIAFHIMGENNEDIKFIEQHDIDLVIALELIDYTVAEYIFDSNKLNKNKAIITVGHFNTEEPGMEYMVEYLPRVIDNKTQVHFVKSGDMYNYI